MSYVTGLRCLSCKTKLDIAPFRYQCPECGGYLEVLYDYDRMKKEICKEQFEGRSGSILQQWLEFLPIEQPELIEKVTLGEIPTPMFKAKSFTASEADQVWFKNESQLPTYSLKDRSMPLMILKALELGRDSVGIVSSGNASASLAAYAASAGLKAVIFVGESVPQSKLYKTMVYDPIGIQVIGDYNAAEENFQKAREEFNFFDCNGLVNPYRIEGKKTFSYEVARDLGWKAPDTVIMSTAYGNGIVATWKGFKELYDFGFIETLPHIIAVQPANCAPIERAYRLGLSHVEAVEKKPSLAEAVSITDPAIGGARVLEVIKESKGMVVAIEEEDIRKTMQLLASKEGLAIEGAGALGAAAWIKLKNENNPIVNGVSIVSLTGIGLNDLESGIGLVNMPNKVTKNYEEAQQVLRSAFSE